MNVDFPGSETRKSLAAVLETAEQPQECTVSYPSDCGGSHTAKVVVRNSAEKIQAKWVSGNFYETHRHGMLNYAYQKFRGGTFVDIGAPMGNHTLFFNVCCKADRVISIEPVPKLFDWLLENIRLNGLDDTHVHNVALGGQPGDVGMYFRDLPIEQGGMLIGCVDETGSGTSMDTLDNVIAKEAPAEIRCIKIDVEGYSLPVLVGGRETILKYRPAIFCECETPQHFDEVNEFLTPLGYRAWQIHGRPFVMNHTPTYLWEYLPAAKIVIAITSYNRPAELRELLERLCELRRGYDITCLVYDDCSELDYADPSRSEGGFEVRYRRMPRRFGKTRYWQLINRIFDDVRNLDFDYFMQLPDDVVPLDDFFDTAVQTWDAIDDPQKICLNLYLDKSRIGRANWTKTLPTIEKFGDTNVFRTGWADMIFMADRRFLMALNYRIEAIDAKRWMRNPALSSGVGAQIAKRLRGFSTFQVRNRILESRDIPSQMHPNRPAHEDLSATDLEPIVCGIASIPHRQNALRHSIESVLPYVDELHVYLNNYKRMPSFLRHPKIRVYRSQEHGDLGDAGKFFRVGETTGFYIAIDDDIVYPNDFVWRMVSAMRQNRAAGKRIAVGMHGRVMAPDVESYYRGHRRVFHFNTGLEERRTVHVLGTGVLGFHTGDIDLSIRDFDGPRNMADIHFAIACQRQNVGCVVLPHEADAFRRQNIPGDTTIWSTHRRNDAAQTRLFNAWSDWRLRS